MAWFYNVISSVMADRRFDKNLIGLMKKLSVFTVLAMLVTLSSCQLIGDIFKAGVWVGVLIVVVIVALVIFILAKLFGGGK